MSVILRRSDDADGYYSFDSHQFLLQHLAVLPYWQVFSHNVILSTIHAYHQHWQQNGQTRYVAAMKIGSFNRVTSLPWAVQLYEDGVN